MFRFLLLALVVVLLAAAVAPAVVPVLTWILAFLSLLMLGDLVLSAFRRHRRRTP